jgi:hypothetical protein
VLHPTLAERNGHVKIGGRMMHDMHGPTPTDAVAYAMVHVESQIVEHEAQQERSPSDWYFANGKGCRRK